MITSKRNQNILDDRFDNYNYDTKIIGFYGFGTQLTDLYDLIQYIHLTSEYMTGFI